MAMPSPALVHARPNCTAARRRQIEYLKHIQEHDITFAAGSSRHRQDRILRWRKRGGCSMGARSASSSPVRRSRRQRPGFPPGDLAQKVDPICARSTDALYDLMGFDRVMKMLEKQAIEIALLAYMRGRTLNHAFIILDEAQGDPRADEDVPTRIGIGAKAVITGDVTQVDLPKGQKSGLIRARRILHDARHRLHRDSGPGMSFAIRSSRAIVAAYEAHQKMQDAATPSRRPNLPFSMRL